MLMKRLKFYLPAIGLIAFLSVLVYQNSFSVGFQFDDHKAIADNASIRDLSNLPLIFRANGTRPILYLSFALNYHFGGTGKWGYHLVNLFLHILNGILVYFIVFGMSKTYSSDHLSQKVSSVALLTSLLFIAHPIQTEAVTYIISRSSVLCTTFYLLSLYFFIKARGEARASASVFPSGRSHLIFSIFFFSLALFTKELAATLPFVLFLYDYIFVFRHKSKSIKERFKMGLHYLPFGIILILFLILKYRLSGTLGNPEFTRGLYSNLLSGLHVMVGYLNLLFFPHNQSADPNFPASNSLREPAVLFSIAIIVTIIIIALRQYKKIPLLSFGIVWYFLSLLPT